jgi:hypothetical protein
MGFEPPIPASERAKTVHALDRSATVTGSNVDCFVQFDSVFPSLVIN